MTVDPVIDGEVVNQNLPAVREEAQALVPAQEMTDLLARGAQQATIIADLLRKQRLVTRIGPKEHIRFEGWVPIATANGKRLDTLEVRYEGTRGAADFTSSACVGLRDIRSGEVVAKAWASCSRREPNWKNRDDYAIESMAQTRAGGKVCRMVYGWIIALAGFEATPSEEINGAEERAAETTETQQPPSGDHQGLVAQAAGVWQMKAKSAVAYAEKHKLGMAISKWADADLRAFIDAMAAL